MEIEILRLSNGLRVLHIEDTSIMTVHCGFIVNAGSRDEKAEENGLAHLIEHCLFKGTRKRKAFHILNRLDSVGGEINAYTTKEETAIYATVLREHFQRAAELLVDITFSSKFPEREIVKEKGVIRDEINSYRDNPDEMLLDDFEERLFPNNSLGRSILGTEKQLEGFQREDLVRFVDRNYTTDQIIFACVGNLSKRRLMTFCRKTLEPIPLSTSKRPQRILNESVVFNEVVKSPVHQVHALIGAQTLGFNDDRRRTMILLNNVLGGPALNSRLNLNIRERYGYCYYIESNFTPYSDSGVFQIYFGTDSRHLKKVHKLVTKELKHFTAARLKDRALHTAKRQLLGQIALAQENRAGLMLSLGKSLLQFDRIDDFDEIEEDVMSISAADVRALAEETFDEERLSSLTYIPS